MEGLQLIKGIERYSVNRQGQVYDNLSRRFLTISNSTGSTGKSYQVFNMVVNGKPKQHYLHRVLAEAFLPNPDNLPQVDHRDGNGLNNTLTNLRWATVEKNAQNRKSTPHTSRYMGVSWENSRSKWAANIHINNKKKQLGRYNDEVEAARAYDEAAKAAGFEHVNFA